MTETLVDVNFLTILLFVTIGLSVFTAAIRSLPNNVEDRWYNVFIAITSLVGTCFLFFTLGVIFINIT
jgi:hypothetical protein